MIPISWTSTTPCCRPHWRIFSARTCMGATSSPACSTDPHRHANRLFHHLRAADLWRHASAHWPAITAAVRCRADAHPRCRRGLSVPGPDHRHHCHSRAWHAQHFCGGVSGGWTMYARLARAEMLVDARRIMCWQRAFWVSDRGALCSATRSPTSSIRPSSFRCRISC